MSLRYVAQYVASHLQTEVELYHPETEQLIFHCDPFSDYPSVLKTAPALRSALWTCMCKAQEAPVFSFINGAFCCAYCCTEDGVWLIGPFRLAYDGSAMHARHTTDIPEIETERLPHLPRITPLSAAGGVLLLYNLRHEDDMSAAACFQLNFDSGEIHTHANARISADLFQDRENDDMHNTWGQEVRLLKCIEEGDEDTLKRIWMEPVTNFPRADSPDPVRSGKNMAIYNVTACGRAAIRGGLSADYIFALTDSYTQQIEDLQSMPMLQPLVQDIQLQLASMVRKQKEQQRRGGDAVCHPLVAQAKTYVFRHLHEKLTVEQVAEHLHVHPNFLTSLFHREEGISLYQYILAQKIDLAKNLLIYSDYSYIDIANYLGFTSQSHLGARFKAATGMTLREYRNRYKKETFDEI